MRIARREVPPAVPRRGLRGGRPAVPNCADARWRPTALTIPWDGGRMVADGEERLMAEMDKSEKITINLGLVDLGQIDLLVDEGFYANRTDFIRTAIRR